MPRKFKLNWDEPNKCWFKYYHDPATGRRRKKYLKRAKSKTYDKAAYEEALKIWTQFSLNHFVAHEEPTRAKKKSVQKSSQFALGSIAYHADQYLNIFTARQFKRNQITQNTAKLRSQSIRWLGKFLGPSRFNKAESEGGGLDNIMTPERIEYLKEYFTSEFALRKNIAYATARTHFGGIKQFIKWAFESGKMKTLPRNFYSRSLYLTKPKNRGNDKTLYNAPFEIYTDDEIAKIINAASQFNSNHPTILYILLLLNTGMSTIDVGTLRWGHLQFDPDNLQKPIRIRKSRSKTGQPGEWILWDITSECLQRHLEIYSTQRKKGNSFDTQDFIFHQIDPNRRIYLDHPIMFSVTADSIGKYKDSKTLVMLLRRIRANLKLKSPMKHLRKTAASHFLEAVDNDLLVTQQFLGHTPKTVAEKHYARNRDTSKLDAGIKKIESSLGISAHIDVIRKGMDEYQRRMRWEK